MAQIRSTHHFTDVEESEDKALVRCLICKLYDPEGLGNWIHRRSLPGHLKSGTHLTCFERRERDQRERQQEDSERAAAYAAPSEWPPIPALGSVDLRPPPYASANPMFDTTSAQTWVPDEFESAEKAPAGDFDIAAHEQLLQDEIKVWLQRAEERELGLWDEEEDEMDEESDERTFCRLCHGCSAHSHIHPASDNAEPEPQPASAHSNSKYRPWPNKLV